MRRCLLFFLFVLAASLTWAQDYNILDYGAVPDTEAPSTQAIQRAIDCASLDGGRVVVPKGRFVTGSLYLKSGVELHLEEGAVLMGSTNPEDYVKDDYCHWTAMIFAIGQHHVGITGKGIIDGRGSDVAANQILRIHAGLLNDPLKYDRPNEGNRPELIHFRECDSVTISGITLKDPASWCQQYDQCRHLVIEGITVSARAFWNNDGLDVVDCSDVVVRHCHIDAADDAYCFKSHSKEGVSENVAVEHCWGSSSANGIKFGTMTRGIFRHFRFSDITIVDTYRSAINISCVDGGNISDIAFDSIRAVNVGNPFFIRFSQRNTGSVKPALRDISISNLYASVPAFKPDQGLTFEGPVEDQPRNISPSSIIGTPNCRISNIRLHNIYVVIPGGTDTAYAYCAATPEAVAALGERETQYPEFSMFKELPACGLFIRHADSVMFDSLRFFASDDDYRPYLYADDASLFPGSSCSGVMMSLRSLRPSQRLSAPYPYLHAVSAAPQTPRPAEFKVSQFGIRGNLDEDNTLLIQQAVDSISRIGGGTLVFYVGRYCTGRIKLPGNVNIRLEEGAILVTGRRGKSSARSLVDNSRVYGLGYIEVPQFRQQLMYHGSPYNTHVLVHQDCDWNQGSHWVLEQQIDSRGFRPRHVFMRLTYLPISGHPISRRIFFKRRGTTYTEEQKDIVIRIDDYSVAPDQTIHHKRSLTHPIVY